MESDYCDINLSESRVLALSSSVYCLCCCDY